MFDTSVLFAAFKAHGMLQVARRVTRSPAVDVDVGFVAPDELILGDAIQSRQVVVEYATASAVPPLDIGEALAIGGVRYRVREHPRAHGDGTYTRASLEKLGA